MHDLRPIPVPDLSGRVVLVTGAGRGIGAALARILRERGARVFAGVTGGGRDEWQDEWKDEWQEGWQDGRRDGRGAERGDVPTLPLDVTSDTEVDAAIERVAREAGRLDALVNNAGVIDPITPLADLPSDDLAPAFAVNVIGLHRVTRAALPLLRASRGTVVNAGTGAATTAMEGWTAYCSSKAAARMMTQMMALELAPHGVRSFFLGIPPTDTAMQEDIRRSGLNPVSRIPRGDLVHPDVPASALAWLCGPDAGEAGEACLDVRDEFFRRMM